jgi:16S rRNA (cytosine1402-N4)-methyltransferase
MMTDRDGGNAVDGGLVRHIPVLAAEVLHFLNPRDDGIYVDGTFGAGGYARAILDAADCRVIGIDRDRSAIERGAALVTTAKGRLTLIEDRFSALDAAAQSAGHDAVDGVVLDIGVSSMQLDEAARGFSFRHDGPLDMRMGNSGPSAADLIAVATDRDLAAIIARLGEERFARPVARAIVRARSEAPILTTKQLSAIVERVVHARPGQIHPATRTFQALRIFINEELVELAGALTAAERILKPGGRLVVVSFHSLEDRIVKTFLAERSRVATGSRHAPEARGPQPTFTLLTKKAVAPGEDETAKNPRARSAKLRAAERNAPPARPSDGDDVMPGIPTLAEAMRGGR